MELLIYKKFGSIEYMLDLETQFERNLDLENNKSICPLAQLNKPKIAN